MWNSSINIFWWVQTDRLTKSTFAGHFPNEWNVLGPWQFTNYTKATVPVEMSVGCLLSILTASVFHFIFGWWPLFKYSIIIYIRSNELYSFSRYLNASWQVIHCRRLWLVVSEYILPHILHVLSTQISLLCDARGQQCLLWLQVFVQYRATL